MAPGSVKRKRPARLPVLERVAIGIIIIYEVCSCHYAVAYIAINVNLRYWIAGF
jgi:hypothetical protein